MRLHRRTFVLIAATVAGLLPAAAQAQWYSSYPPQPRPYGYGVDMSRPYAIEVAPNTYVIRHPGDAQHDATVRCGKNCGERNGHKTQRHEAEREVPKSDRPHKPANRALIEELERRMEAKRRVADATKIVRDPPVVIVHKRVVDDPPRVIERRHVAEDVPSSSRGLIRPRDEIEIDPPLPPPAGHAAVKRTAQGKPKRGAADEKRVIHAEAEVTILGPDRMSIRLYRKRGSEADAEAQ
jgi:hypothetical protein